ncbi:MAG: sigma-70 family RNA polymerase sigma factor [Clostridiales bacterium]|nr:sigma-70 family RNA polymerase sigma factor [Clostridiales bacterium]
MDAYIFRVCQYTWAKFLRKNKKSWECVGTDDCLDCMESSDNTEETAKQELYDKLRREIVYLGKVRREAIIMFYYDGKGGEEISNALGIPAATVRWHLHSAKKEL